MIVIDLLVFQGQL